MSISSKKKSRARRRDTYHVGNLREALIDEALAVLPETGVDGLSLRKLAQRLGVSHNAPYMHFPAKDALMAAIAERGFVELSRRMAALQAQTFESWDEGFIEGCCTYVRFGTEQPDLLAIMFMQHDGRQYPSMQAASLASFEGLVDAIRAGQAMGLIAEDDARDCAATVWSLIHGIAVLVARRESLPVPFGNDNLDNLVARQVRQLLVGLKRRPS